ncbi:MAG: chromosomal replication initiator protein DnaA [Lactobacillaceae bacterium]|jgi:chromosomal replication initiator protein|nr:chromosomal replication initiator protein DnaA [Lactobacillaceae bacterium]
MNEINYNNIDTNDFLLKIKNAFKNELDEISYRNFIEPIRIINIYNRVATLGSTEFVKQGWDNSTYYIDFIKHSWEITGGFIQAEIEIIPDIPVPKINLGNSSQSSLPPNNDGLLRNIKLNPKYVFDTWVSSSTNMIQKAMAIRVSENLGDDQFNPFFIYGTSGVGKTHLMQAIGNQAIQNNPNITIKYITAEDFANAYSKALNINTFSKDNSALDAFKNEIRNIDLLLIDDIQFIEDKTGFQEEFFNTFNAIRDHGGQIVITSDKQAAELKGLPERLSSRFQDGYSSWVDKPDEQTRIVILQNKAKEKEIIIPDDAIFKIAASIDTNVRELESVFNNVAAYALINQEITVELVENVLKKLKKNVSKIITISDIQKSVADYNDITMSDIISSKRDKNIVLPRQIAMYLSRKLTNSSLPQIGKAFGGKDHTTVMHGIKKIEEQFKKDSDLKRTVDIIEKSLIKD